MLRQELGEIQEARLWVLVTDTWSQWTTAKRECGGTWEVTQ